MKNVKGDEYLFGFYQGLSADELINMLPEDQIRHSLNVEILVGKFVEWLPISEEEHNMQYFSRAAYYHDIGKVCVLPYILNKLGALTAEERYIVRCHTIYAQDILAFYRESGKGGIPSSLLPLTEHSAVYHHEWWNGKGYPYGLSGQNIPYVARVTSICDAYDAMVSNRPYHHAFTHEYACEEVKKGAGTQFDPSLVKIFLKHETEIACVVHEICKYSTDKLAVEKKRLLYSKQI